MDESGGGTPLILTSLVALILAASGLYVFQEPLLSSRPFAEEMESGHRTHKIRAHLWQDPFRVAKEAVEERASEAANDRTETAHPRLTINKQEVLPALAVALPSDNSLVSHERRLRHRYAVWAALDTLGFKAADGNHVHILPLDEQDSDTPIQSCRLASSEENPTFVYELATTNRLNPSPFRTPESEEQDDASPDDVRDARQVLIIWADDRIFDEQEDPLKCILDVAKTIHTASKDGSSEETAATDQDGSASPSDSDDLPSLKTSSETDQRIIIRSVGPNSSDTLVRLDNSTTERLKKQLKVRGRALRRKRVPRATIMKELTAMQRRWSQHVYFSPMATADEVFFPDTQPGPGDEMGAPEKLTSVDRTIATDLELARVLVDELRRHSIKMRTPKPGAPLTDDDEDQDCESDEYDRILLISEWDTFYGRALPMSFAISLLTEDPSDCDDERCRDERQKNASHAVKYFERKPRAWSERLCEIERVNYLRGLDGRTTEEPESAIVNGAIVMQAPEDEPESATGHGRLDYVRRLALKLRDRKSDKSIRAIGILGSDVYDKLLLIRALRDLFPQAVFFTTDLDARYSNPEEIRWTRNLLVASSFGLRLIPEPIEFTKASDPEFEVIYHRQQQLPPFRDNYQTSVYYATLRALGLRKLNEYDQGPQVEAPRLFEIGQWGPYLLATPQKADPKTEAEADGEEGSASTFPRAKGDRCFDPEHQDRRVSCALGVLTDSLNAGFGEGGPDWKKRLAYLAAILIAFALWFLRRKNVPSPERMSYLEMISLWGGLLVIYGFVLMVSTEGVSGEPFTIFAGISVWPTEAVRLASGFLALFLLGRTHRRLQTNAFQLGQRYSILRRPDRWSLGRIFRHFRWVIVGRNARAGLPVDMVEVWRDFYADGGRVRRAFRITVVVILYLSIVSFFVFRGYSAIKPIRDELGFFLDVVCLVFSIITMLVLLIYVVDAVMLDERLIKVLSTHGYLWPDETFREWGIEQPAQDSSRKDALSQWLGIRLLALRTEVLGGLVVGPFLVLALFLVSRASFFDRWYIAPQIWTVMSINAGVAVFAATILWRSAEGARAAAGERLNALKVVADTKDDEKLSAYIGGLASDVADMRRGAFAPIWRQPFVQAVLAPLGGWAATLLIESWIS